jgi:undecaprenyl-diphosphatase
MLTWVVTASLLLLTMIISVVFVAGNSTPDEKVFNTITRYITEPRTNFIKDISFLGNHKFLIPANLLLIIYFVTKKNKWGAVTVAVVELSSLGLMSFLKNMIGRHRPAYPLVDGINNFGFPSGHAFMSVAFYGLLAWWAAASIKNKLRQRAVVTLLIMLILVIGFSRIYLRVHYTSDVLAGYCIGICWLIFCLWLIEKIRNCKRGSGLVQKF